MQILCLFVFLFLFKGSSKCGFFHLAVLLRFYRVLFLHHVFLSEQIKMMMMMMILLLFLCFCYVYSKKRKRVLQHLGSHAKN